MWTIAQGMAPLYPQRQRSHTLAGRLIWRHGELSPSCLEVRFLRSSHGDDHGSEARRGEAIDECELATSTSRLRSHESPGQSAHRARWPPANAIAHRRRSTESPK